MAAPVRFAVDVSYLVTENMGALEMQDLNGQDRDTVKIAILCVTVYNRTYEIQVQFVIHNISN